MIVNSVVRKLHFKEDLSQSGTSYAEIGILGAILVVIVSPSVTVIGVVIAIIVVVVIGIVVDIVVIVNVVELVGGLIYKCIINNDYAIEPSKPHFRPSMSLLLPR